MSAALVIDAELVRRLVRSQFPQWADLPVRPVELDGWDNRTFRLGDALSVRLPSGEGYAQQVEKEQRWLPRLAPGLPLPIPTPVSQGVPGHGYPYAWSIYAWLEGRPATEQDIGDLVDFAAELAGFLAALHHADTSGGPEPGPHNFFRGGPLATYAEETHRTIDVLGPEIDGAACRKLWEQAIAATWMGAPVWCHGDVAVGNLLLRDRRLSAVIDFGCCAVGDPACDLVIAWTLLHGPSRDAFRQIVGLDGGTWSRARGWALWKALITLVGHRDESAAAGFAHLVIERLLADRD